jgi:hypothetical protein
MGNIFIVGSGLITVDMEDVTYTNQPLYSGMKYDVFCRAVGTAATGVNIYRHYFRSWFSL